MLILFSSPDNDRGKAKFTRKLNSQVAETADALDRDNVARAGATVAQGVKGRRIRARASIGTNTYTA